MDVDPPEKPIKSLKDFAVHIMTVTIGILIALGLEALVDAYRHHVLIEHARADFRAELTQNRAKLALNATESQALKEELEGLITYNQAKLANKPATPPATGHEHLRRRDLARCGDLPGEEPAEHVRGLDHGAVAGDVGHRAEDVHRLGARDARYGVHRQRGDGVVGEFVHQLGVDVRAQQADERRAPRTSGRVPRCSACRA